MCRKGPNFHIKYQQQNVIINNYAILGISNSFLRSIFQYNNSNSITIGAWNTSFDPLTQSLVEAATLSKSKPYPESWKTPDGLLRPVQYTNFVSWKNINKFPPNILDQVSDDTAAPLGMENVEYQENNNSQKTNNCK